MAKMSNGGRACASHAAWNVPREMNIHFLTLNLIYCGRRDNRVDRCERKKLEIFFFLNSTIANDSTIHDHPINQASNR